MADYQLTENESVVLRTADGTSIPDDPANTDYMAYTQWLDDGGVPDPYVPPEIPPPEPTNEQLVLVDHENRLRSFEGLPPLTAEDFINKMAHPVRDP
jgi:hypothetical protein